MKIETQHIDDLNAEIKVTIEPADYQAKYNDTLRDQRKKANFKGFRKGKTPMGYIKKLYGKAILADVINDVLQKAVVDYLVNEKIEFLGQPLASDNQGEIDFDTASPESFEFVFDLGLAPKFDLKGIEDGTYQRDKVEIPDKMIQDELDLARRRLGEQKIVEDAIQDEDILLVEVLELEAGKVKEGGHTNEFTLMVNQIGDEKVKQEVLGLKPGGTFDFNIYKLEKDRKEDYVRKYLLGLDDDADAEGINPEFRGEVKEIRRMHPAELNQDFFDKFFGEGKVTSEAEAHEAIREDIARHYLKQADALLYKSIQESLMEKHDIQLPEAFLKRWLSSNNPEVGSDEIDENFEDFRQNLKWRLIKSKVVKKFDIKVEPQEIQQEAMNRIINYVGAYQDEGLIRSLMQRILQDQEQVERISEEIEAHKIFEALKSQYKIVDKKISFEKFKEKLSPSDAEVEA